MAVASRVLMIDVMIAALGDLSIGPSLVRLANPLAWTQPLMR